MKNINYNICDNCGEKNPLFLRNCSNCSHSLREKVVNINLWETFYNILHAPTKTLKKIIYAEHKNFAIMVLLFLSIKFYLSSIIFQSAFKKNILFTNYETLNLVVMLVIYSISIILFALILKWVLKIFNIPSRFRDNLSILVYSFLPVIISSIILIPIEYGIFGEYWFTFNPSPFVIKPFSAYLLLGVEVIMFLWSILILFKGMILQSGSYPKSIIIVILFILILSGVTLNLPYYLF